MNAQRRSGPGDGDPAAPAAHAVPPALARRGRALVDAVEALVASPRGVALTERQAAEARDIVRRLVEAIEIDLMHFLSPDMPHVHIDPVAWTTLAARGLPVAGLARPVLARALERGLTDPEHDAPARPPDWASADAVLADLWMRYILADRRRRDSWHAPMIVVSDLPVETQAALSECVAAALLAKAAPSDVTSERYADACARVIALHREETGIGIAAARLVDAALAGYPAAALIEDFIDWAAWPAIFALVARFAHADAADTAIYLASATSDEIHAWLSQTPFGETAIAALCRAIELTGGPRRDEREELVDEAGEGGASNADSPATRIAAIAERYRSMAR